MDQPLSPLPRSLWLGLLLLWLLACALAMFGLGDLPLRDFDEATVARVSLELSTKKGVEQLFPTLWTANYINKPPGLHFLIAGLIRLTSDSIDQLENLPSEFVVRLVPALLSSLVVPFGGLIQWYLRPKEPLPSLATAGILLTLLPIARHGRLAMLDGTQLSAMALLWLLFLSFDKSHWDKLRALFAGFVSSFLLLLKAPFLIPALIAAVIPIGLSQRTRKLSFVPLSGFYVIGLLPGILWHILHGFKRGSEALWLWGGDGATRVLFSVGEGSDLGSLVPILEILEGGWPWLMLWPFGIAWAWKERHTPWGQWSLMSQLILAMTILPLKTQLPWYSHPLWLPFSLLCGMPFAWLVERQNNLNLPFKYFLARVPYAFICLGLCMLSFGMCGFLKIIPSIAVYSQFALSAGTGWVVGGWLLTRSLRGQRFLGSVAVLLGSFVALVLFMGSSFWLWELNETWPVRPVAQMISEAKASVVFIDGNHERPSLNWYAGQHVKRLDSFSNSGWILTRNATHFSKNHPQNDCRLIQHGQEWDLMFCKAH